MVKVVCEVYGYELDEEIEKIFIDYCKIYN